MGRNVDNLSLRTYRIPYPHNQWVTRGKTLITAENSVNEWTVYQWLHKKCIVSLSDDWLKDSWPFIIEGIKSGQSRALTAYAQDKEFWFLLRALRVANLVTYWQDKDFLKQWEVND
jgi:hypothetical protein